MKGLILINAYSNLESQKKQIGRLSEEFAKLGVEIIVMRNNVFPVSISNNDIYTIASQYDFVLYLDKDKYIAEMIEASGVIVFDNAEAIRLCDDKMLTHIELVKHRINTPNTLPGLLCYTHNAQISEESLDKVISLFGFPLIVKESFGSLGKGVYLVNNREELKSKMNQLINVPHIFQEYIASSYGQDIRVLVIGGQAFAWMRRHSTNDFRSNIEQGGSGCECVLKEEYKVIAEQAAKALNLDYCGVDILIGPNQEPIICEVNSNAFFNELEKVSKKNVAKAYAEYIIKTIKEKKSNTNSK